MDNKNNNILTKWIVVCLLACFSCMLWGSATPAIKTGYRLLNITSSDTATQVLFAGIRFTLAGIIAVIFGSIAKREILLPRVDLIPKIIKVSIFQTIIQYFCFYVGLAHTTGVKGAIVCSANAFVSIVIASVIFRQEKLTSRKMIGCLIGFIGVSIVILSGSNGFNFNFSFLGEGLVFLSVVAYAFSTILVKEYSKNENPVLISGYQFIFGGIVMMVVSYILGGRITISGGASFAILGYLSLLSAIAYSLWSILLKYNPVSKVAVYGFMTPIFGVLLSAIFLNETSQAFGIYTVIALVLVCTGIIIVNTGGK